MPQPIDPNTEIMRITAAERIQQIADRASLAAQARQSAETANKQVDIETQVRQMNQKSAEVDEELARKNPYLLRRRKKRGDKDKEKHLHTFYTADEQTEVADDPDEHSLDITI